MRVLEIKRESGENLACPLHGQGDEVCFPPLPQQIIAAQRHGFVMAEVARAARRRAELTDVRALLREGLIDEETCRERQLQILAKYGGGGEPRATVTQN